MRETYMQELEELHSDLNRMGRYVARAIERARLALTQQDLAVVEQAVDADERIDDLADQVEASTMSMLALQAPVASDLRFVTGAMKLAQTLERMGDLARHISQIVRGFGTDDALGDPIKPLLTQMADIVTNNAKMLSELISDDNSPHAANIIDADEEIDELHLQVRTLVRDENIPLTRSQIISITLISRFLERLGDHQTKAAWRILFIRRGQRTSYSDT